MNIETERTRIRDFQLADLEDVCQFFCDEQTVSPLGYGACKSKNEVRNMLLLFRTFNNHFAIELKAERKVIGFVAVNPDLKTKNERVRDVGFVIAKEYRCNGYMKEVLIALSDWLFKNEIDLITASCYQENIASQATLEAAGFCRNGTSIYHFSPKNQFIDCFDYTLAKPNR